MASAREPAAGRVICVGHAAFDSVFRIDAFPSRPTKVRACRHDYTVGGMAANAACAIAALGGRATFWGPVGDDEVGARILEELARAGVATERGLQVPGVRSSHSAIIVESSGERLIVSAQGDALQSPRSLVDSLPLDADAVMVDVRWPDGAQSVAARARAAGIPVVLDGEMGNIALLRAMVPLADHVIFSEPGWAEWLGHPGEAADAERELQRLVAAGAALAAVTLGERGLLYATRGSDGVRHLPAFAVAAVETLGAGDAFHGAYALAIAEGARIEDALRFASATAALRCSRPGGRVALPTRAEVASLLAG